MVTAHPMWPVVVEAAPMRLELRNDRLGYQRPTPGVRIIVGHHLLHAGSFAGANGELELFKGHMQTVAVPLDPPVRPTAKSVPSQAGLERLPGLGRDRAVEIVTRNG